MQSLRAQAFLYSLEYQIRLNIDFANRLNEESETGDFGEMLLITSVTSLRREAASASRRFFIIKNFL